MTKNGSNATTYGTEEKLSVFMFIILLLVIVNEHCDSADYLISLIAIKIINSELGTV